MGREGTMNSDRWRFAIGVYELLAVRVRAKIWWKV